MRSRHRESSASNSSSPDVIYLCRILAAPRRYSPGSMEKSRESEDSRRIADHVGALRAYVRLRIGGAIRAREESADIAQSVVREALEDLPRFSGDARGL